MQSNARFSLVLLLSMVALMALSWPITSWRMRTMQGRMTQFRVDMVESPSIGKRLRSARKVLRIMPDDIAARVTVSQCLTAMARYDESRENLWLLVEGEGEHIVEAVIATCETYLAEAYAQIDRINEGTAPAMLDYVQDLMKQSDKVRKKLDSISDSRWHTLTLLARQKAAVATVVSHIILGQRRNLLLALEAGHRPDEEDIIQKNNLLVERQKQIQDLDREIEQFCRSALLIDELNAVPQKLLFDVALRNAHRDVQSVDNARIIAAEIAQQQTLSYELAGYIANTLLNIDEMHGSEPRIGDEQLARLLLEHKDLRGDRHLDFGLGEVSFALRQDRSYDAEEGAKRILDNHPEHERALCLLARALMAQDLNAAATQAILGFNDRNKTALGRYTLGMALLADGNSVQGREALKQALEVRPAMLLAQVRLAESYMDSGTYEDAEIHIRDAMRVNPRHPRVRKLQVRINITRDNRGAVIALVRSRLADPAFPLHFQDVAVVVAMVLDDVVRVETLVRTAIREQPNDPLYLLADGWSKVSADQRAALSGLIARVMLNDIDAEPLLHPLPPTVQAVERRRQRLMRGIQGESSMREVSLEPLYKWRYVPWREHTAADLVRWALSQPNWKNQKLLMEYAVRLCIGLGLDDIGRQLMAQPALRTEVNTLVKAMRMYLTQQWVDLYRLTQQVVTAPSRRAPMWFILEAMSAYQLGHSNNARNTIEQSAVHHPWNEMPLIVLIRESLKRDDPDQAYSWIDAAGKANQQLRYLVRGRTYLAQDKPMSAVGDMELLVLNADNDSEYQRLAGEIKGRAFAIADRIDQASGLFQNLGQVSRDEYEAMLVADADVLMDLNEDDKVEAILQAAASDAHIRPRWLDQVLARLEQVIGTPAMLERTEELLKRRPTDPVLLYYHAASLRAMGKYDRAEQALLFLSQLRPGSPRVMLEQARLASIMQNRDLAIEIYRQLIRVGGDAHDAAMEDMRKLGWTMNTLMQQTASHGGE